MIHKPRLQKAKFRDATYYRRKRLSELAMMHAVTIVIDLRPVHKYLLVIIINTLLPSSDFLRYNSREASVMNSVLKSKGSFLSVMKYCDKIML